MSFAAMAWATKQRTGSPVRSLILLHIASMANDEGVAWPSYQYLADVCECSRRTVIRNLMTLEDKGFVRTAERRGDSGSQRSNSYQLVLSGPKGGDTMSLGGVTESHRGGDTVSPGGSDTVSPRNSHSTKLSKKQNPDPRDAGFDVFYAGYPRKAKRPDALKAWRQVKGAKNTKAIQGGLAAWHRYWEKSKTEEVFIPYPASWLRSQQWNDEPPPVFVAKTIPKDDDEMVRWAAKQGFRQPRPQETYHQFRKFLQDEIRNGVPA